MTFSAAEAFSPAHLQATVADLLKRGRVAQPTTKRDASLDADGDQLRLDSAPSTSAWDQHLHSLHGRDLRSPPSIPGWGRADSIDLQYCGGYVPKTKAQAKTDGNELYLDDTAWHKQLHSLHGKDLDSLHSVNGTER